MQHMSMLMWLARKIDQLETAGLAPDEVAIAITDYQEKALLEELEQLEQLTSIRAYSAHHAEYHGWRIIVKGRNQ